MLNFSPKIRLGMLISVMLIKNINACKIVTRMVNVTYWIDTIRGRL